MPAFAPLRRTYSALSSSLSSSDDTHNANLKEIAVQPSDSSPRTLPRHSFLIRFIIFFLLESGFITLVSVALHRPIILDVSLTNSEIKGAVTVTAIIWHALAGYAVKDILLNIFSAEWMGQYDKSKRFTLQELDIVSRLTTGLIDQARYCTSTRATLPFCLSFLSFLLLMLLNGLGPSAIGIDLVYYDYQGITQVANLTLGADVNMNMPTPEDRANAIVQLEVMQNIATVGFSSTQSNILIPWPSSDSLSGNISMRYDSDVIRYNLSCSWRVPSFVDGALMIGVDGNQRLEPFSILSQNIGQLPAVLPLFPLDNRHSAIHLLFVSTSDTLDPHYVDLPSLLVTCNTTFHPDIFSSSSLDCNPLLLSALVCDSQPEILPAIINATMSSLEATILPGAPTVKNIPTYAANHLFLNVLNGAIGLFGGMSTVSAQPLFPMGSFNLSHTSLKLLSLDQINQNMTKAIVSAAKAYLSGYVPGDYHDPTVLPSFAMVNISAVVEEQRLALVGRKPFFVASSAVVGLLVVLLSTIVAITRPDELECFDLENIVRKLN